MKILICGLPGAGKTWLAERLIKVIDNCAWYNADVVAVVILVEVSKRLGFYDGR